MAAPGAEFEYRATVHLREHFGALTSNDTPEHGRHFRRRDEITCLAEFCSAGGVVAKPGCVQGVLHILGKTDAATCIADPLANKRGHTLAVRGAVNIGFRQCWRQIVLHVNIA